MKNLRMLAARARSMLAELQPATAAASRYRGLRYFFVSGVQKSGTNWICHICETHPLVGTVGELHLDPIHSFLLQHADRNFVPLTREYMDKIFLKIALDILREKFDEKRVRPGNYWLGDHSPGLCYRILPGAPRIAVIRDPRDVLVSAAFHSLRTGTFTDKIRNDMLPDIEAWQQDKWYFHEHPDKLIHPLLSQEVADRWLKTVRYAVNEHAACTDGTLMLVQYEKVHQDVNLWRDRMLRFIGADPSGLQPLKPGDRAYPLLTEDPGKFRRKGQVGDWKNYDSPELLYGFKSEHRELMTELGYV